ncbi:MAG: response regulator [Bacteroidota bacterium]|nr:response regulator [Bacteroidota bacterium]MDP4192447.1 response regulator [Bacteroidota bacterium]MDP4193684.1 response regulator [Bacteroidota bacterium]
MEFLLVEDNEADIFLISLLLEESLYQDKLTVINDGAEAIKYLSPPKNSKKVKLPDLMILDLNLPRRSGLEVLQTIKDIEELKDLKIVVLTSSENQEDVILSKQLGAIEYFSKPTKLSEYENIVKSIFEIAHKQIKASD